MKEPNPYLECAKKLTVLCNEGTPETDAEEERQRKEWNNLSEIDWPAFPADFDFARKLERERNAALEEVKRLKWLLRAETEKQPEAN